MLVAEDLQGPKQKPGGNGEEPGNGFRREGPEFFLRPMGSPVPP